MRKIISLLVIVITGMCALAAAPALLLKPVEGEIVLGYGPNPSGVPSFHHGIDIACPPGTPVAAPLSGTVIFAGYTPAGSGTVTIETRDGWRISILQLEDISVRSGEFVTTSQPVGVCAAAGDPSFPEPHIHLGVRDLTGKYINPADILIPSPLQQEAPSEQEKACIQSVLNSYEAAGSSINVAPVKAARIDEAGEKLPALPESQPFEKETFTDARKSPGSCEKMGNTKKAPVKRFRTARIEAVRDITCPEQPGCYLMHSSLRYSPRAACLTSTIFLVCVLSLLLLTVIMQRQSLLPSFARGP